MGRRTRDLASLGMYGVYNVLHVLLDELHSRAVFLRPRVVQPTVHPAVLVKQNVSECAATLSHCLLTKGINDHLLWFYGHLGLMASMVPTEDTLEDRYRFSAVACGPRLGQNSTGRVLLVAISLDSS